jgi:hypothetical protein
MFRSYESALAPIKAGNRQYHQINALQILAAPSLSGLVLRLQSNLLKRDSSLSGTLSFNPISIQLAMEKSDFALSGTV